MNSTTSSNGLLIVDSDLFGADANYSASWIENSWVQTAEPINCGATEFIRMSFQTRYRCWDNGSSDDSEKCLVEISRDGVNWPNISTFSEADGTVDYGDGVLVPSRWEVFPGYETGSETGNPSFIDLDISSAAGGQEQVWIRFRWSGTWGYSWEIDDIFLQEAPMNDLRMESYVSTTDYANTGMYELGAIPLGQLTNYQAGVTVKNIGINPQSGVQLNLSADGTTIGTSPMYSLDYDAEETLQAAYALNGLGLGSHTLEFEVSADAEDDYPENNSATRIIEVTEYQLGRDNGSMTGLFPSDGTVDFMALNPFDIYADATIYAIDVAIAAGSESGVPIVAHLFDSSHENFLNEQYGGLMMSTQELYLDGSLTNDGDEGEITWYTLVLEDPIAVSAGQSIAAGFEHYGGSNVQIWESQFTFDQTSFVYGPFGSGQAYDWYYTNEVPMVRLNFNPNAANSGAGCTDPQACNYNPNAVEDNGSCEYETCEAVWMQRHVITTLRQQFQMHSVACIQRRIMIVRAIALTSQHVIMSTILHPGEEASITRTISRVLRALSLVTTFHTPLIGSRGRREERARIWMHKSQMPRLHLVIIPCTYMGLPQPVVPWMSCSLPIYSRVFMMFRFLCSCLQVVQRITTFKNQQHPALVGHLSLLLTQAEVFNL